MDEPLSSELGGGFNIGTTLRDEDPGRELGMLEGLLLSCGPSSGRGRKRSVRNGKKA